MPLDIETYRALGLDQPITQPVNGHLNGDILDQVTCAEDVQYVPCPEASPDDSVPPGTTVEIAAWTGSRVYPGTARDIAVHLPAGLEAGSLVNLIVFNDGAKYLDPAGPVRATRVLDSLHAGEEISPTVAVFVNPGVPDDGDVEMSVWEDNPLIAQRSLEYDSLTPDYGRLLVDEIIPFVQAETGIAFTDDPKHRTLCGISSGGIAAFNAAWHHPDDFRRVLSHCGSFTDIRGGHNYPYIVRSTGHKPLRVYMQSGDNDARIPCGDWPLANRLMAASLEYAGYDVHFEYGQGAHSLRHGGSLLADSLRWLWRD
jgi:enterochelin esterase-like enzyme